MKQFRGFPAKMQFSPLPKLFFSQLLPKINDIVELKTTLYFLQAIYHKRGYPRFVTYKELLNNAGLMSSINKAAKIPDTALRKSPGATRNFGLVGPITSWSVIRCSSQRR